MRDVRVITYDTAHEVLDALSSIRAQGDDDPRPSNKWQLIVRHGHTPKFVSDDDNQDVVFNIDDDVTFGALILAALGRNSNVGVVFDVEGEYYL